MEFFQINDEVDIYKMKSGAYQKDTTLGEGAFGKVLLGEAGVGKTCIISQFISIYMFNLYLFN